MLRNFSNLRSLVRAPAHASKPHQNVVKFSPAFVNITVTNFRFFSSKNDGDSKKVLDSGMTPIQDIANSIDTTLTPEQQEYVNKLKKQLRGGVNSPRSIYREVPLPHEVVGMGNFMPRIAENAEELIDYALSHIPPKAGKRGTRRAKRMELKWSTKRKYDAIRKEQIRQANLRRHQRFRRIREEVRAVKEEAARQREIRQMKAEARAAAAATATAKESTGSAAAAV